MNTNDDVLEFYRQHHAEVDVVEDQFAMFVLYWLGKGGPITIGEMSDQLREERTTLASICRRLREAELISLDDFDNDKESIELTDRGHNLLKRLFPKGL